MSILQHVVVYLMLSVHRCDVHTLYFVLITCQLCSVVTVTSYLVVHFAVSYLSVQNVENLHVTPVTSPVITYMYEGKFGSFHI